ncbi:MAG TPA: rhodanese-like domain-containing protein [Gemmatimonadaceae bacterium]|jgi:hydroxyacylglutathione hydrolase|nr:rhodanese-like domain-containing protein [Gemmatimonadaceae bacterium]
MLLERLYDDALAQASYLIACESTRDAIVIDPQRDIRRYEEAAGREKVRIVMVTETHIHADFLSGSHDLARRTGAKLLLSDAGGAQWRYAFAPRDDVRLLHHGDTFDLGKVRFTVRHTPGHTPEHICFLVTDTASNPEPVGMLTGDFIFAGEVGRPDLLERAARQAGTMESLARVLFRSLQATSDLHEYLQLWPGHGPGSACGKSLGAMPSTTMGYERIANWAFQVKDEDEFVRRVLDGQPEPPKYFARMKSLNRDGPPPAPDVDEPLPKLDRAALQQARRQGLSIVDVRSTADFAAGHIQRTLNIPVGTSFPTWAGALLPYDRDIVILADDEDRLRRARTMLAQVGHDRVVATAGRDVREAWTREVGALECTEQIGVGTLAAGTDRLIVDVRGRPEWETGHIPGAEHRYLGDLLTSMLSVPRDTPIAVHCQGGTRSAIAASLLQAEGFTDVANIKGGIRAWHDAGLPVIADSSNHSHNDQTP